jgi:propane monooxygenase reductase subunit
MGEKHTVRLEPVGIDMEVDEDETILDAAFRQGLMLMHGCKEGQCAACKSFILDGDVDLDRYSTFALPDYEEVEGYTLLCRAHAQTDLEIELIHFDEELLQNPVRVQTVKTRVVAVEPLTHDIRLLRLRLAEGEEFTFQPGQYVDIRIPGTDEHRSFSMANTPASEPELTFMIKLYPGGRFSSLLEDGGISVGDELEITGPYGTFTLRPSSRRRLVFIGGGAGMAPILSLLRSLAEQQSDQRPAAYYYGARALRDLFYQEELQTLVGTLRDCSFVPALSEADSDEDWQGERGFVTDVCDRLEAERDLTQVDAYVCGPPPMVDAAIALLERRGVPEAQIYYDKFTTTAQ